MPKRARSGHIGPVAGDLINTNRADWFDPDPNEAGTFILQKNLMPYFRAAGLASAANSVKTQGRSIRRAVEVSGYKFVAAGVGRGHSFFSPGAKWTFPASSASSTTCRLPSSLSSCVRCVKCFKTPDVAPAGHRQCQRGHSLCDECFEGMPAPSKARHRGATTQTYHFCPKQGCNLKVSGDNFRNLVVEHTLSNKPVDSLCPICCNDFDGLNPIIQCEGGHCLCLTCYDDLWEHWKKKRKQNRAEPDLQCPLKCCVLASQNMQHTYRNKAAEYLFAHKFV